MDDHWPVLHFRLFEGTTCISKKDIDRVFVAYQQYKSDSRNHTGKCRGKMVAIELEKPYPANYQATVQQVVKENETGYLPPLKTKIDSIEKYDVVFVGFTTWGIQLPPPIKSFLKQYGLSDKTIIPFNTNAGYGVGSSFETLKAMCIGSGVLEGFEMKGGVEREGCLRTMR